MPLFSRLCDRLDEDSTNRAKTWIKLVSRSLLGEYSLYRIYAFELPASPPSLLDEDITLGRIENVAELVRSGDPSLRDLEQYSGEGAIGFGLWMRNELASVCWYWAGNRYRQRNFWPLAESEAKLVHIATAHRHRGKGLATRLITHSANAMGNIGFQRLFARVWHSNKPSIQTFERAGWRYVAFVMEIKPFNGKRHLRWVWRSKITEKRS